MPYSKHHDRRATELVACLNVTHSLFFLFSFADWLVMHFETCNARKCDRQNVCVISSVRIKRTHSSQHDKWLKPVKQCAHKRKAAANTSHSLGKMQAKGRMLGSKLEKKA